MTNPKGNPRHRTRRAVMIRARRAATANTSTAASCSAWPERTEPAGNAVGLPWDDRCLRTEQNNRRIGMASNWQTRQLIHRSSVEWWRRYEPWLGELRELLPQQSA